MLKYMLNYMIGQSLILSLVTFSFAGPALAGKFDSISLKPGKLLQVKSSSFSKVAGKSMAVFRMEVVTSNAFAVPQVKLGRQNNKDKACEFYGQNLMTSDYNESKKTWTHNWDIKLNLLSSASHSGDCFAEISYPGRETSYVLIQGNSNLTIKKKKSKTSNGEGDSDGGTDIGRSHGRSNCPSYDCQDEPRRSTSPGGPDDISDEPSREDDDSTFDGGGYSSNNGL